MTTSSPQDGHGDPFADIDAFLDLPRLSGLWLSPDGGRLVVGVGTPDRNKNRFSSALWELDPAGERPARRLTRSTQGESQVAFTPRGDLLFVSARPDPGADKPDDEPTGALWWQPAAGGDARVIAKPKGGISNLIAGKNGELVYGSGVLASADSDDDTELREARRKAKAAAILHESFPARIWDHDLGPEQTRLFAARLPQDPDTQDAALAPRDITGNVGTALIDDCTWDLTPDGRTLVTTWFVQAELRSHRATVVAIDIATGERRALADDPEHDYANPRVSPDGTLVAVEVRERCTPERPDVCWLGIVPLAGGDVRALTPDWDRWPHDARWTPDGGALVVCADDQGRAPLWLVDAATGTPTRLTPDDAAYSEPVISPDGRWVYALRAAIDSPPAPVRVALAATTQHPVTPLRGPAEALGVEARLPGRVEEITATAADGTPVRGWLALPHDASADAPAPLLVFIHGGPLSSWNTWQWRWNAWPAVARGYAVLLPDPALSTGYGTDFLRRGWSAWGAEPFTDLMSITDAAEARADIDAQHTAALGGSFGGYMANWIAGHSDRFDAIVSHASVWNLDISNVRGDVAGDFMREMSRESAEANSPHHAIDAITTPMLVIHGDRDYRCPIGEGQHLWYDLCAHWDDANGPMPHKFLYFPDEGHWILKPAHIVIWYTTVLAFLDHHVRGLPWQRPDLLG
jgi:dipeptidyl aminopeptidase/acylaminoacyl peptidase